MFKWKRFFIIMLALGTVLIPFERVVSVKATSINEQKREKKKLTEKKKAIEEEKERFEEKRNRLQKEVEELDVKKLVDETWINAKMNDKYKNGNYELRLYRLTKVRDGSIHVDLAFYNVEKDNWVHELD